MATTTDMQATYPPATEKDTINGGGSHQHGALGHQQPVGHQHHDHHAGGALGAAGHGVHNAARAFEHRKFANPAPLGLCAFALTTFVLSAINMEARDVKAPNVVVPLAFGYGGVVQLLAGMWEMAVGNTFGATALSSYGGFWISYALLLTPSLGIMEPTGPYEGNTSSAVGFFLTGWFIFTLLLLVCTLRSSLAFFLLFFTLDLAFLFLACEEYANDMGNTTAGTGLKKAGGFFGFLAAFLAWYNALAGIQYSTNSFFTVPVFHFPWSDKGREQRAGKSAAATV